MANLRRLRPCAVRLERIHIEKVYVSGNRKRKTSSRKRSKSCDALDKKGALPSLKRLRSCPVRLERIHLDKLLPIDSPKKCTEKKHKPSMQNIDENWLGSGRLRLRPRPRGLEKPPKVEQHNKSKNQSRPSSNAVMRRKGRQPVAAAINEVDSEFECEVELERLRYADIMVTARGEDVREVYYTLEAEANGNTTNFEDWRLETFKALETGTRGKTTTPHTNGRRKQNKSLILRVPLELSYVFNVNGIKDRLPSILSVLSGSKMSSYILDAYITRQLEKFRTVFLQKEYEQSRRSVTSSSQINFQYLSALYYPIFKEGKEYIYAFEGKPHPMRLPKFRLTEDTILIAPQLTCQHFYLAIFDFPASTINVYDSSWNFVPMELRLEQVIAVLRHLLQANPDLNQQWDQWYINFLENCVQQNDEFNCGCYVIHFTQNLLNGRTTTEASFRRLGKMELVEMRRNIVRELLPTTNLGKQILEAIAE